MDIISKFKSEHKGFTDILIEDTWLMEEPITLEEVKACWECALYDGLETVSVENFQKEFGFSLQDFTNYINNND